MTRLSIFAFSALLAIAPGAMAQSTSSPSAPAQGSTSPAPSPPVPGQGTTTQTPSPSAAEQGATPPKPDPQQHLADIQKRLDSVANMQLSPDSKQNADAKQKLAQLREDFTKLVAIYRHKAASSRGPVANSAGENPDPAENEPGAGTVPNPEEDVIDAEVVDDEDDAAENGEKK